MYAPPVFSDFLCNRLCFQKEISSKRKFLFIGPTFVLDIIILTGITSISIMRHIEVDHQDFQIEEDSDTKIDILDPLTIRYLVSPPQAKKYPTMVKQILDEVSRHVQKNQHANAIHAFTQLDQHLFGEDLYEQWVKVSLQLKIRTLNEQFYILLNELKKAKDTKQKIEEQANKKYAAIFFKANSEQFNKIALVKLLLDGNMRSTLSFTQKVDQFSSIGKMIEQVMEYRWLVDRHKAYNKVIFREYAEWSYQQMKFKPQRQEFKLFIDQQYSSCKRLSLDLKVVEEDYFRTKNFFNSFQMMSVKFPKETLKNILQSHYEQYQYIGWFSKIEEQLISNKILPKKYFKNEFKDRLPRMKDAIDEIINVYNAKKANQGGEEESKQLLKLNSEISRSTAGKSSLILEDFQLNQKQIELITYKSITVKDIYQERIEQAKEIAKCYQKIKDLEDKILLKEQQVFDVKAQLSSSNHKIKQNYNQHATSIQSLSQKFKIEKINFQDQNQRIKRENIALIQQNKKINSMLARQKQKFEKFEQQMRAIQSFEQVSMSRSEDDFYIETATPMIESGILSDEKSYLLDLLMREHRFFTLQRLEKIFSYPFDRSRSGGLERRDLLSSIQGRNHLLFVIKLKSGRVITAYIEKGVSSRANQSFNMSEILENRKIISQINSRNQSQILNHNRPSRIQSSIEAPHENSEQLENGFIITHWNRQRKFIPDKRIELLKVGEDKIQIGHNDLIINLRGSYVKSLTGKSNQTAFINVQFNGQLNVRNSSVPLFDEAEVRAFLEKMQIFHLKLNNQAQTLFRNRN